MFRSITSIFLVVCLLWQSSYAVAGPEAKAEHFPPEGEVIILSDDIGPEIDRDENDRYGLFPGIPDFISAKIIQKPDSLYVIWVTFEKDGQQTYKTAELSKEVLKRLYELVGGIPTVELQEQMADSVYWQGLLDGRRDATGNVTWVLAGFGGSLIGDRAATAMGGLGGVGAVLGFGIVGAAIYFVKPEPPASRLAGETSQHISGYTKGYREKAYSRNIGYAIAGAIVYLTTILILIQTDVISD